MHTVQAEMSIEPVLFTIYPITKICTGELPDPYISHRFPFDSRVIDPNARKVSAAWPSDVKVLGTHAV